MATPATVLVSKIENLRVHPNADKLEICDVLGWQIVVPRGVYANEDKVIYFPPDSIIPTDLADKWNVRNYLKGKKRDRVGKVNLRGEPSFGLIISMPNDKNFPVGTNVANYFGVTKYEPPTRLSIGAAAAPHPLFDEYTDIENLRNYPHVFEEGEEVVCTEKIHGTNCRIGFIDNERLAGSMRIRRAWPTYQLKRIDIDSIIVNKLGEKFIKILPENPEQISKDIDKKIREAGVKRSDLYQNVEVESIDDQRIIASIYWFPWTIKEVRDLLENISCNPVILYGEVYGESIQSLGYGIQKSQLGFRAFDLKINGRWLNYDDFSEVCEKYGVETAPVLYRGPFNIAKIKEISDGKTTLAADHIREGTVVRPVIERSHPDVGRLIMKYLGDTYLLSKNSDFKDV